jgi:O-antigen/teichoic acid export membrane protein
MARAGTVDESNRAVMRRYRTRSFMERSYRNLGYFLLVLLPIFVAGFWIPYLAEIPVFEPSITPPVHVHAALLFAWLGILIFQPFAIRYQAFAVHRLLGKVSYVMMTLIVPFTVAMMWKEYHEKLADGASVSSAFQAEFVSAAQLVVTVAVYVMAIVRIRKRDVPAHMRYMICIALFLLPAGLARTLGYWFHVRQSTSQTVCLAVIDLCLVGLIAYDRRCHGNPRPYVGAFLAYNVTAVIWIALGRPV